MPRPFPVCTSSLQARPSPRCQLALGTSPPDPVPTWELSTSKAAPGSHRTPAPQLAAQLHGARGSSTRFFIDRVTNALVALALARPSHLLQHQFPGPADRLFLALQSGLACSSARLNEYTSLPKAQRQPPAAQGRGRQGEPSPALGLGVPTPSQSTQCLW